MEKLGIIAGSSLIHSDYFSEAKTVSVKTPYGDVLAKKKDDVYFIQRHTEKFLPPHRINHEANIYAFKKLGIKFILGINSVGSLKRKIPPGSFVAAHDYIELEPVKTFHKENAVFCVPGISGLMREKIIAALKLEKIPFFPKGVYFQRSGPRYETPAETRLFGKWADVAGMTMACEATLAAELGLEFGNLSVVDNYCNGLEKSKLCDAKVLQLRKKNNERLLSFLSLFIASWN